MVDTNTTSHWFIRKEDKKYAGKVFPSDCRGKTTGERKIHRNSTKPSWLLHSLLVQW
ncbi:MAG: hypothetical protein NZ901_09930 [Geminocystis sp.]|nr:hypothetical protein [Geminocystis sp.]HIK37375.1 hypothetical protein [Geminocystis sp. M7585_C2015_104]MCS7148492.1 hypothetical protein [Geminocystis sp.]MCX8079448.1 hypothetical protein [Geminocystis sp.]MDW8114934.1 hypothetical protein [Geminocystis sp.]